MKILDVPQGSMEWLQARAGLVTASRIADVMAKIKSGESAARADYKAQIVTEILTGVPAENGFTNDAMQWGTDQEPAARAAYEAITGNMVEQVGMVYHPEIERAAASPDGMVSDTGLVEIKCPKTATHLQYLLANAAPTKYQPQMLWQMACTGAEWCDFVSFDPRLPNDLQLLVVRFGRYAQRIKDMEAEVKRFLSEVDEMIEKLQNRKAA